MAESVDSAPSQSYKESLNTTELWLVSLCCVDNDSVLMLCPSSWFYLVHPRVGPQRHTCTPSLPACLLSTPPKTNIAQPCTTALCRYLDLSGIGAENRSFRQRASVTPSLFGLDRSCLASRTPQVGPCDHPRQVRHVPNKDSRSRQVLSSWKGTMSFLSLDPTGRRSVPVLNNCVTLGHMLISHRYHLAWSLGLPRRYISPPRYVVPRSKVSGREIDQCPRETAHQCLAT